MYGYDKAHLTYLGHWKGLVALRKRWRNHSYPHLLSLGRLLPYQYALIHFYAKKVDTFRFLKGHPNQLRDYKLFLIVGVTAMLLGVGIMGYSVCNPF